MSMRRYLRLSASGVLGLNKRNGDYIMRYNPRTLYPLVDNKLLTKQLALKAGLAVPDLYGVIATHQQIGTLGTLSAAHPAFVLKPACGSAGDGIIVISGRSRDRYRTISGDLLERAYLEHHIANALSGQFSLGGVQDAVMIEYMVRFSRLFEDISYQGVPDIRIIVFRGLPLMAMVRLPTRGSHGKANLHQGAVGAGVDMGSGVTLDGVFQNEVVTQHPDTNNAIAGIQIPQWERVLEIAARCYELTGMGYIGVDIVLDRDRGPLLLELNARPGLAIQIANQQGLLRRLQLCEQQANFAAPASDRVAFAQQHFKHPVGPLLLPASLTIAA
jgi:alpha-L-glutamate ligase-like protein